MAKRRASVERAPKENKEPKQSKARESGTGQRPACFVMMPITDPESYPPGHFKRVYEDIFMPACEKAGYQAVRADDVRQTNLIHVDVLHKVVDSPMAICDLSGRNPNVLFELGLRVAFDKPVLLLRDGSTEDLFDIAPLRYTEYRRERTYHEVIEDQDSIARALRDTYSAAGNSGFANSMVRLLALPDAASLPELPEDAPTALLQLMRAQIEELTCELRKLREGQAVLLHGLKRNVVPPRTIGAEKTGATPESPAPTEQPLQG